MAASAGLYEVGLGLPVALAVRDLVTAAGFGAVLYSLYTGAGPSTAGG